MNISGAANANPVRVLHLLKTSVGASWALRQMRGLIAAGYEVHAAMPPGPLVAEYLAAGVHVHPVQLALPVRAPWRWRRLFDQMRGLVETVDPMLIHSHFVATTLTMRLALRSDMRPRIFQVPGPLHLEHVLFRRLEIATATAADRWVASCEWTRTAYRASNVGERRVFLNYYGVDLGVFSPRAKGRLRRELGVDSSCPIVGMVAYMYAPKRYLGQTRGIKGHEDLIDAFAEVLRQEPKAICVMVGSGWDGASQYERKVREYARQRCGDGVVFLGKRTDVHELYPDFDVAVHPSHSENVGGAVESLLLEIPTIATRVGGFPDLVIEGETGWLVPPRDPAALSSAILEALSDQEQAAKTASRGMRRAAAMFDAKRTGEQMAAIYEVILHAEESP